MIHPLDVFELSVVWPATVFREMVGCRKIPAERKGKKGNLLNDFDSDLIFLIGA